MSSLLQNDFSNLQRNSLFRYILFMHAHDLITFSINKLVLKIGFKDLVGSQSCLEDFFFLELPNNDFYRNISPNTSEQ